MSDLSGSVARVVEDKYMRDGKPLKSKMDRVKESISILKKLTDKSTMGIPTTEPGYLETKKHLDEWIAGGDTWVGRIDFPRYGRRAELVLPDRADKFISMKIFAPNK